MIGGGGGGSGGGDDGSGSGGDDDGGTSGIGDCDGGGNSQRQRLDDGAKICPTSIFSCFLFLFLQITLFVAKMISHDKRVLYKYVE